MRSFRPLVIAVMLLLWAAPVAAKEYTAERYDVRIQIRDDGTLRVTETIVLLFEDGTFTSFFREIPTRRTDGIEVLSASLDGRVLPWGDETGQAELTGRSRRRITWRFPEVESSRHMFSVTYEVRGVIRREDGADVLAWRALPGDHNYAIVSSTVVVEALAPLAAEPDVRSRRVGALSVMPADRGVVVSAQELGRDGYVDVRLAYPEGAVIDAPPAWQRRRQAANEVAPRWAAGAAAVLVLGLVPFLALRTRDDAPPADARIPPGSVRRPPDDLPPPLAGMLASAGQSRASHALAALFSLADRGVVAIDEQDSAALGRRRFEARRLGAGARLTDLDRAVLDAAFTRRGQAEEAVALPAAARRLAGGMKTIRAAMQAELAERRLWHADRARGKQRHTHTAVAMMIVAAVMVVPTLFLVDRFLGWPLLLPAALFVAAAIGLAMASSRTPLSNEGERRAAGWRAYGAHLKAVGQGKETLAGSGGAGLLALAVALGVATYWAKYLKLHPGEVPDWFHSTSSDDAAVMAAFIAAVSSSNSSAGAGAGAGAGAAGGGSSGAS